jgi:hypothetical protein
VGEDLPVVVRPARVHRGDDALAAELGGDLGDDLGPGHRRRIDRHLVRAREQQRAGILDRAHSAADGKGHEAHRGCAADHVEKRAAPFVARGDVEEAQLVGPGRVIGARLLDRVAGVLEVHEVDPLDHASVGDVEARDDADADGHEPNARLANTNTRKAKVASCAA